MDEDNENIIEPVNVGSKTINVNNNDININQYIRKIYVNPRKVKMLKLNWKELIKPVVEYLKLAVKFDVKTNKLHILPSYMLSKTAKITENEIANIESTIPKAVEYFKAFLFGFKLQDIIAILRLDDIYLQTFQVTDIKKLVNDNLGRAIGRIVGRKGRTKDAIQNATKTRIILEDKTVHLLGSYENIALARDAICSLILGVAPNSVHNHLAVVNRKIKERS